MAYDEALAGRVRRATGSRVDLTEKRMFGGIAFLIEGTMFCGVVKDDLMVRVGPARYEQALAQPHARPMDFTGRPLNGYVFVGPDGTRTERAVKKWAEWATAFVATLSRRTTRPSKADSAPRKAGVSKMKGPGRHKVGPR